MYLIFLKLFLDINYMQILYIKHFWYYNTEYHIIVSDFNSHNNSIKYFKEQLGGIINECYIKEKKYKKIQG